MILLKVAQHHRSDWRYIDCGRRCSGILAMLWYALAAGWAAGVLHYSDSVLMQAFQIWCSEVVKEVISEG